MPRHVQSGHSQPLKKQALLKALGKAATRIGFNKPLSAYTEHEAMMLIDIILAANGDILQGTFVFNDEIRF
jgi:hypothetical protein